ncbi:hypothetical protein ACM9HD_34145, partial [Streptomyces sp. JAC25]|uniref:hypothetical protein n=1 Tax=Streptomyces sp. JAC25 TaxID=3418413 RepID=UPI003D81BAC2
LSVTVARWIFEFMKVRSMVELLSVEEGVVREVCGGVRRSGSGRLRCGSAGGRPGQAAERAHWRRGEVGEEGRRADGGLGA